MDLDGVEVNGKKAVGSISSVIDTGTTLIIDDKKNVAAVYKQISGAAEASQYGDGFYTSTFILCRIFTAMLMDTIPTNNSDSPLRLQYNCHADLWWNPIHCRS